MLSILFCACAVTFPFVLQGASCGHDFDFHVQSWLAVADQWRHGVAYPHWLQGANYGAGEPRFVFYPPLTWIFGALLGLALPWTAVPVAFTWLVLLACGLSMRRLAQAYLPAGAATVAACAYMANPYALFVAYERTAYGELAAGIWLPLLLLYGLLTPAETTRNTAEEGHLAIASLLQAAVPLALLVSATWLTNAPGAVMACYLLGAITLWQACIQRSWQPLVTNAAGLLLGLGLASFYLVPAAYERRWVDIQRAVGPGMRIQDSFLFAHTGEAFHDQVLRTASWIMIALSATICAALLLLWISGKRRRLTFALALSAAVLLALQLRWSSLLWNYAPELKFLQFPWRLSLVLSIAFAIAVAAAFALLPVTIRGFRWAIALCIVAAVTSITLAGRIFWQPCDEEDVVSAQVAVFQSGAGFEGTDEYTTLGIDNSIIPQALPELRALTSPDAETAAGPANPDSENPNYLAVAAEEVSARIDVLRWQPEEKWVRIDAPVASYGVLRLMDYPSWQVAVNGSVLPGRPHRDDGLLTVPLRAGSNTVEVRYRTTPDVLAGRALTCLSLAAVLALAARRRLVGYHEPNAA